ncbi:hypothetical protein EDD11_006098 [Mortierella claussenii]|nr:hypothetical protein EDD11_006098 [Mortierella claussenii]
MSELAQVTATSTEPGTTTSHASSNTAKPELLKRPHCWGSFEYEQDGIKHIVQFTKEGNEGESGVGGYVFGRKGDCDFVSNGTFINNVKVGMDRRVQLKNQDTIRYLPASKSKERREFIFTEGEPVDDLTFDSQYERGPQLGSGNFATVFRATNRKTGVVYAVKVVRKNESFSARVEASLEREIDILMSIDQENLLRVCQVFNEPHFYYLVTELAPDGELFDQIIDKQKFTESETRHIFRQVLEGVKYLHDRGVVHRDLKPENILVMDKEAMIVKISDFGLAKMIGEHVFFNTVCGTPSYVAPEVIRNGEYGKGVDMWSLGVVLYICLCGFPPFSDDLAPPKLRIQVLQSMYSFPSPYWDEISDEAVDLVQGLLAQNADDRLTVDEALEHVWMTLEDDQGTKPTESRTEPMPAFNQLLSRVMTERADRAVQRGVRVGLSQATPFSQSIPDLPEDDEPEELAGSPELKSQEFPPTTERNETAQSVEMNYDGSGIGFFSQEGMVRGTGMDTDSEDEEDNASGSEYHSLKEGSHLNKADVSEDAYSDVGTNDAIAGNDSDRSFMSVQESFNTSDRQEAAGADLYPSRSLREVSMNGGAANEAAVSNETTDSIGRSSRHKSVSDEEGRSTKRAKTTNQ